MRIFFSVGEPSGDVHGANLVRELQRRNPDIECVGFGGPKMKAAGCALLADLTELAVMFLWQALRHYFKFRAYLNQADAYFRNNQVDAVVLIDYPGFNWLVAKRAKRLGIPVYYYGVPQMWAWAPWRIHKLRRWVDFVLCKLPFEPAWFQRRGVQAEFVGHPFFDDLVNRHLDPVFCESFRKLKASPTLLLLPGSRDSEVERHWPWLREAAIQAKEKSQDLRIVVGCFNNRHFDHVRQDVLRLNLPIETYVGRTPELMSMANLCAACSGSVSLELMYYQLPTVIVYRISWWKFQLQRFLIRAKYITLVNLMETPKIARDGIETFDPDADGAAIVPMPEYLTWKSPATAVSKRISQWLVDSAAAQVNRNWLGRIKQAHAQTGATNRAAERILGTLLKNRPDVQTSAVLKQRDVA